MRRTLLPLAIAAAAATVSAQTWLDKTPSLTTTPSFRRTGAMAFDGTANRLILYGGVAPTPAVILDETWSYNGTLWTKLNPAGGAAARWGHQLVRHTPSNQLITFGGRSPTISGLANDLYAWNGTVWATMPTNAPPPARFRYGMAFDSLRNRIVMFGGRGLTQVFDDTWELEIGGLSSTWTHVTTANSPPPREDMVMAYDSSLNRTVLFGGYDPATDTLLGDTWEYDGVDWQQRTITNGPSARYRTAAAFDSTRKRIVMYGGFDGTDMAIETWEYVGGAWNLVSAGGSQLATETYNAFDSQRNKFVTFGGVGASFSTETWEFTGANTGALGSFGVACPTSVGVAFPTTLAAPHLNSTYTIDWQNLPLNTPAVITVHGASNVSWSGIPLPFELSILGLAGCNLLVSGDIVGIDPAAGGFASTSLAIPNTPSLVNTSFFSQILIPDADAANSVGGTSLGARSLIGQ